MCQQIDFSNKKSESSPYHCLAMDGVTFSPSFWPSHFSCNSLLTDQILQTSQSLPPQGGLSLWQLTNDLNFFISGAFGAGHLLSKEGQFWKLRHIPTTGGSSGKKQPTTSKKPVSRPPGGAVAGH